MKRLLTLVALTIFLSSCASQETKILRAKKSNDSEYLTNVVVKSTKPWQVEDAAYYLSVNNMKEALPALKIRLADQALESRARGEIAAAIAKLGDDSVTPDLIAALEHATEVDERCRIIQAIGKHCTSEAIAALQQQTTDSQIMVSRSATTVLQSCQ